MSSVTNPGNGKKAGFRRITVTLPQDAYERLIKESARRKIAGEQHQLLSALLREAVGEYLIRLPNLNSAPGAEPEPAG